jgi:D-methionine transport system substrate-binding protein
MRLNFVRSALAASVFLVAANAAHAEKVVVGATQVPHAEILEVVKPQLDRKANLVPVALVHVEPFGGYSKKIKSLSELKDGATVAIPNDPSNGGRALVLLQKQGVIKLKDPSNILATAADVVENPKKLKFRELEAAMLPRSLDDVDLALINTNYALEAGLVPTKDALFIEGSDSPYANILVTRADNKDAPGIKKLVQALHTPEVKKFIQDKYKGAVVPAF